MKRRSIIFLFFIVAILATQTNRPVKAQTSGITVPADGSAVSGDVVIQGTATIDSFQKYELYYKLDPSTDDAYAWFDGGTQPVQNAPLGIWRTGALPAGIYSLRLRVTRPDGNYNEFFVHNLSVNQVAAAPAAPQELPTPTPTETPAQSPTPALSAETPIPTFTFTPAPTPTPNVGQVTQPAGSLTTLDTPTPVAVAGVDANDNVQSQPGDTQAQPSDTQAQAGAVVNPANVNTQPANNDDSGTSGVSAALGEAFSMDRLRTQFWNGVRYSAALCLAGFVIYGSKLVYSWSRRRFR